MGLLLLTRLFALVNTTKTNTAYFHIAESMLAHYHLIESYSINEMAELCSVSKSTLSKFTRHLGFEDYISLKESAGFEENRFNFNLNYLTNIVKPMQKYGTDIYFDAIDKDIELFKQNLDRKEIDQLAQYLINYEKVATFGLLFSGYAALDLQAKLGYAQKIIYTSLDDRSQHEFIEQADNDTLIIIFSNSGSYISENQLSKSRTPKRTFKKSNAKVVLITSNEDMLNHEDVDHTVLFHNSTSLQTHSIIYQILIDLIVSRYRDLEEQSSSFKTE